MSRVSNLHWSHRCRQGDFTAIPAPLTWNQSGELAHLIDGYTLTGSQKAGLKIARRVKAEFRAKGASTSSALDIWVTLFFEHRYYCHSMDTPDESTVLMLDALCERLRQRLLRLDPKQRAAILGAFHEPAPKVMP